MKDAIYTKRLSALKAAMKEASIDSFLVTNTVNISYLSGFRGTDALMLMTRDSGYFLTDSRYIEEAKGDLIGRLDVRLVKDSTFATIESIAKKDGLKRIGFESMDLPYGIANRLKGMFKKAGLVPVKNLVETLRSVKDVSEIARIRKAISLAKGVFKKVAGMVVPGTSEAKIKKAIDIAMIKENAVPAFEPIIASGANSSKPHAGATDRIIGKNDFVMIDMGAKKDGYNSDFTRTIPIGSAPKKFHAIYRTVKDAQRRAIDSIVPGAKASDIDRAGRTHISNAGFGRFFGHSLGHGIGMAVHEEPSISPSGSSRLAAGMVFTVEPAIYIPGFGGVRIEDMVLVTKTGCEILTA